MTKVGGICVFIEEQSTCVNTLSQYSPANYRKIMRLTFGHVLHGSRPYPTEGASFSNTQTVELSLCIINDEMIDI